MKSFQLLSFTVLGAMLIAGCSGGGSQRVAGRQCPLNYKSAEMVGQKLWKKGDNDSSFPVGTYAYDQAHVIYTEKGDKGLVIHVQDTLHRDGTFKASVYCVRNAASMSGRAVTGSSIVANKIIAKANAATEATAREVAFKTVDGRLVAESKDVTVGNAAPAAVPVEKVYEGKAQEYLLLIEHPNKVDYELRSSFTDNEGTYDVSVKLKRTP